LLIPCFRPTRSHKPNKQRAPQPCGVWKPRCVPRACPEAKLCGLSANSRPACVMRLAAVGAMPPNAAWANQPLLKQPHSRHPSSNPY